MEQKLLVITVGTVAAGVGQEFLRQMNARPAHTKKLRTLVRSIDTTHLPATYSNLLNGDWFAMNIDPQYMDAIQTNIQSYAPELQKLLYAMPPETSMAGGGGIRYNGAGAIIINREQVRNWLKGSFNELGGLGDRQKNIAVALVISAVGATGSGSLPRLIDVVIGAAQMADVPTPLHLNTFILQPGTVSVTDLGLANTIGLYSELAASQLSQKDKFQRWYQGRTIVMGWGNEFSLASLAQLREVTATLIRVINDPISGVAAEYLQRVVDNYVLRELDPRTGLPSHLSAATPITISLGNLEEQFIAHDITRLFEDMIIGSPKDTDKENHTQIFKDTIASFLLGNGSSQQYDHLLEMISEGIELQSNALTLEQLRRLGRTSDQAARLRGFWQDDRERLASQGRKRMENQGRSLAEDAVKKIVEAREQAIQRGISLTQIKRDYEVLLSTIQNVQREAHRDEMEDTTSKQEVENRLSALARAGLLGGQRAAEVALNAVKYHLRTVSFRTATSFSVAVLRHLARHCTSTLTNISAMITDVNRVIHTLDTDDFVIQESHLLSLAALTERQQVIEYYKKVSIFAQRQESEDVFDDSETNGTDSLDRFRRQILKDKKFDIFFSGDFQRLNTLFFEYVSEEVHKQMKQHTVLDVLLEKDALSARLEQCATRAEALVPLNRNFAKTSREARHVVAFYRDGQQKNLQAVINSVFRKGGCTLIPSEDPTEIIVLYYIDGLPASSIKDLTGRCLEAFLQRRFELHNHNGQHNPARRSGVPVYSGRDAETLVHDMQVIDKLYAVRDRAIVANYSPHDVPDLSSSDTTHIPPANTTDTPE